MNPGKSSLSQTAWTHNHPRPYPAPDHIELLIPQLSETSRHLRGPPDPFANLKSVPVRQLSIQQTHQTFRPCKSFPNSSTSLLPPPQTRPSSRAYSRPSIRLYHPPPAKPCPYPFHGSFPCFLPSILPLIFYLLKPLTCIPLIFLCLSLHYKVLLPKDNIPVQCVQCSFTVQ